MTRHAKDIQFDEGDVLGNVDMKNGVLKGIAENRVRMSYANIAKLALLAGVGLAAAGCGDIPFSNSTDSEIVNSSNPTTSEYGLPLNTENTIAYVDWRELNDVDVIARFEQAESPNNVWEYLSNRIVTDKTKSSARYQNEIVVKLGNPPGKMDLALIPNNNPDNYVSLTGYDEHGEYIAKDSDDRNVRVKLDGNFVFSAWDRYAGSGEVSLLVIAFADTDFNSADFQYPTQAENDSSNGLNISAIYPYHDNTLYELPSAPFPPETYDTSYHGDDDNPRGTYRNQYIIKVEMNSGETKYYEAINISTFRNPRQELDG